MRRIDSFESKEAAVEYLRRTRGFKTAREAERFLISRLPKESYYQSQIIHYLKENYPDAFVWKAAAGPYSRQGLPDVCAVIGGRYYGFEVKRPYIGVLSRLQEQTLERIRAAGGIAEAVCLPAEVRKIMEKVKKFGEIRRLLRRREEDLIKEIDAHLQKSGGRYGLELPEGDLYVIRGALQKRVELLAESETHTTQGEEGVVFTAHRYRCPACGASKSYFGRFPAYCEACGQKLKESLTIKSQYLK